jgi:copper chaperone CopZ
MSTAPLISPSQASAPGEPANLPPSATPETATLNIEGMTCASCSNFVEKALSRTPGVQRATVNLASEKATIDYLPTQIDRAGLRAAIEQAGYAVHEPVVPVAAGTLGSDDELAERKAAAYRKLLRRFWVAVALAAKYLAQGQQIKKQQLVGPQSLTQILDACRAPTVFDFLSIDAEEHDLQVIQSLDFSKYTPRLIIVEDETFDPATPAGNLIYQLLSGKGYRLAGSILKNVYYLKI